MRQQPLAMLQRHDSLHSRQHPEQTLPLCAGGVLQAIAMPVNTGPLGNAITLWLGIEPADLFLYVFLPPMLVDSAVRIDYFIFRKVAPAHFATDVMQGLHELCSMTWQEQLAFVLHVLTLCFAGYAYADNVHQVDIAYWSRTHMQA